jgi:hypothetical protein
VIELESGRESRRENVPCMIAKDCLHLLHIDSQDIKKILRIAYKFLKCGESGEEIKYGSRKFK